MSPTLDQFMVYLVPLLCWICGYDRESRVWC